MRFYKLGHLNSLSQTRLIVYCSGPTQASTAEIEQSVVKVAEGYTITQFCDKIIDLFLKPQTKIGGSYWCLGRNGERADAEDDNGTKQKLVVLGRKVKKTCELLMEIEQSPTDINAVVAKRRKDFNEEFFRHLSLLSETYDSLDDRDVQKYPGLELDASLQSVLMFRKGKRELDSSLILFINSAWGAAKELPTMKNELLVQVLFHFDDYARIRLVNYIKYSRISYEDKINQAVFPGLQGGPHNHTITGLAQLH
ncbi:hypothetical protein C5167_029835 [Papaver somniferum]|nr:hypothetical protein C5167_029835 [Papaver somniferum]